MSRLIKEIAEEIKQLSGVNALQLIEIGLLHPADARNWLIMQKYFQLYRQGMTYTDAKYELSDKYGVSVSSIEKMIYRRKRERSRMKGER